MRLTTQADLDLVIAENKKESVIRSTWVNLQKSNELVEYANTLEDEYNKLYPEYDSNGNVIIYIVYDAIVHDKPVIKDEYYNITYDLDNNETKVLKDGYDLDIIKPTYTYFRKTRLENYTYNEIDMNEYLDVIKPLISDIIVEIYEEAINTLISTYPEHEQSTWNKQEAEAKAYKLDSNTPTPLIDGIVNIRGIDKNILIDKILSKADEYTALSGMAIGYRQKANDDLNEIISIDEVTPLITELYKYKEYFFSMFK